MQCSKELVLEKLREIHVWWQESVVKWRTMPAEAILETTMKQMVSFACQKTVAQDIRRVNKGQGRERARDRRVRKRHGETPPAGQLAASTYCAAVPRPQAIKLKDMQQLENGAGQRLEEQRTMQQHRASRRRAARSSTPKTTGRMILRYHPASCPLPAFSTGARAGPSTAGPGGRATGGRDGTGGGSGIIVCNTMRAILSAA